MDIQFRVRSKTAGTAEEFMVTDGGTAVLGRGSDSAVYLEGTELSRDHCRIQVKGDAILVTDLSSNGTWVDGQRLTRDRTVRLTATNKIELPGYVVEVVLPEPPATKEVPVVAAGSATSGAGASKGSGKTVADMLPAAPEKPPLPDELKPLLDPPRGIEEMIAGALAPVKGILNSVKSEERTLLVLIGLVVGLWMIYNAAA